MRKRRNERKIFGMTIENENQKIEIEPNIWEMKERKNAWRQIVRDIGAFSK